MNRLIADEDIPGFDAVTLSSYVPDIRSMRGIDTIFPFRVNGCVMFGFTHCADNVLFVGFAVIVYDNESRW
jgi:hypothetical protein